MYQHFHHPRPRLLHHACCIILAVVASALASCRSYVPAVQRNTESSHSLQLIQNRGLLLVGTTGDYRPLSFLENDGNYWGFDIDLAREIAKRLHVEVRFVPTSWPTLTSDVIAYPPRFDLAMGGITITDKRLETMLMSDGYLANGKTILCRTSDADKYTDLTQMNKPEVRVMINPGGTNEAFARQHLTRATLLVHQRNEEIPNLIAEGKADIMITEVTEAPYYVSSDTRLAAPLLGSPFTQSSIGVLMRQGQDDLLKEVNRLLREMQSDGTLQDLYTKYGLMPPPALR